MLLFSGALAFAWEAPSNVEEQQMLGHSDTLEQCFPSQGLEGMTQWACRSTYVPGITFRHNEECLTNAGTTVFSLSCMCHCNE